MALTLLKFEVTQEDIDRGRPRDCAACPGARCIARTLYPYNLPISTWHVSREWVTGWYEVQLVAYRTPVALSEFIDKYDDGISVEPFTFEMEVELYGRLDGHTE